MISGRFRTSTITYNHPEVDGIWIGLDIMVHSLDSIYFRMVVTIGASGNLLVRSSGPFLKTCLEKISGRIYRELQKLRIFAQPSRIENGS